MQFSLLFLFLYVMCVGKYSYVFIVKMYKFEVGIVCNNFWNSLFPYKNEILSSLEISAIKFLEFLLFLSLRRYKET